MKKQILAIVCSAALLCALGGCDNTNSDYADQTLTAQIVSTADNELTVTLGEMDNAAPPALPAGEQNADSTQPPAKPDGKKPADGATTPEKPADDSSAPTDMPGEPPQGGFKASSETITFAVAKSAQDELSELKANDIVQLTTDKKGKVTAIEQLGSMGMGAFGGSGTVTQGPSANTIDTDGTYSDKIYTSSGG